MLQAKLKRLQGPDIDLEAGDSKKKLVRPDATERMESQTQSDGQQTFGEKPSFRVIGHFVMAMKRFQGERFGWQ